MPKADPTVIIADDHPLFRVTLRLVVRGIAPQARIVEADSFDSLTKAVTANPDADLVLLDLVMPGVEDLSSLQFLRKDFPGLRVAVISSQSQPALVDTVQALGAQAFIHKSVMPEQLQKALCSLLAGRDWWPQPTTMPPRLREEVEIGERQESLSQQEMRILQYLEKGFLNRRIAEGLSLSEPAVKTHISAILRKLRPGHSGRTELNT
ncbi:MAG: response regulator [Nevskiales bacterium]